MLSKQFIQEYFNADFKTIESLLNEVLVPIFGNYEKGYTEITQTDTALEKAHAVGIKTIKHVATLGTLGFDIKVFDVTLIDSCRIHRARKGIQTLIRQYVDKFEGAFIIFHYEEPKERSWRLSYLEKWESNKASTDAKRFTYLCGRQYPCRTLAERFDKLQSQDLNAVNLEAAFSVEALSDEFFDEYRNFYQDLVNYVKYEDGMIDGFVEYANGDEDLAEKYARDYIKKLMGRLVFIQFLQNKAWLNDDIHYTHSLFDSCSNEEKENFLDNVLEPLFFGIFNTPKNGREALFKKEKWNKHLLTQWKDFPYLNGGLFECDELDKLELPLPSYFFSNPENKDHVRKPSDKYYSDACGIFDFFDRYNFTIDESDPLDREVGVDPEMLGKIFENLLEDNKDKGAFYTPKEIVEYMCKEALIAYLVDEARRKSEVNKQRQENFEEAIRRFVTDPEMSIRNMRQYKKNNEQQIIDLNKSLCSVKICDPAIGSGAFPMGLLNLLMKCRVALSEALGKSEPRAWLKKEIIQNNIYGVDIEKGAIDIARLRFWLSIVVDLEEPEALPNFDYKFMQGNSLLEQYNGIDLSNVAKVSQDETEGYQVSLFDNTLDLYRKSLHEKLLEYYLVTNHVVKKQLRSEINELVQKELDEQHINVDLADIDVSANDQFFLWHTWFSDVFNRPSKQGFDIVIGNPPYVLIDKSIFTKDYSRDYLYQEGKIDLYRLFIEKSIGLTRDKGVISFITPNTFLSIKNCTKLRKFLLSENSFMFIDSYDESIFEASVNNVIYLLIKGVHLDNININIHNSNSIKSYKLSVNNVLDDPTYQVMINADQDAFSIREHMTKHAILLDKIDGIEMCLGAQPYHNTIHTKEQMDQKFLHADYKVNNNYVQDFGGKHFSRYVVDGHPKRWIDYSAEFYTKPDKLFFEGPRIVIREIPAKTLVCAYVETFALFNKSVFNIRLSKESVNIKYLIAVLNSLAIGYYISAFGDKSNQNLFPRISMKILKNLPIPEAAPAQQKPIIDLVDTILTKKKQNPQADTSDEENAIDKLVYQLYGLTDGEINLIEK